MTARGSRFAETVPGLEGRRQMTKEDFAYWRDELRLSQSGVAQALSISRRTVQNYCDGAQAVPHNIALACAALLAGITGFPPAPSAQPDSARTRRTVEMKTSVRKRRS